MEDILRMFNPWWMGDFNPLGIKRTRYHDIMRAYLDRKQVIFLVGMRRVGKTTLMKHFIFELLNEVPAERILYVSMDHPVLQKASILDIEKQFRIIQGLSMRDRVYIFLDEVHLHPDFEVELKVLHDLERTKIFASGSASIFLLEKGAYLTGRQHFIDVCPFDLREYLELTGITYDIHDSSPMIRNAEDHVIYGGLPEYLQGKDAGYLTDLLESILYKDILSRHSLKNIGSIKDLSQLLSQSVGNAISNRKIARILNISHRSVSDYISFFQEIKLIDLVEREGKISERKISPKKIYFTDNGMARVIDPTLNLGSLVENLVFNELRKNSQPRYLLSNGREIDFVFDDNAVEVKYKDDLQKRDLEPLLRLKGYGNKVMITRSREEVVRGIRLVPLYKFLLGGL